MFGKWIKILDKKGLFKETEKEKSEDDKLCNFSDDSLLEDDKKSKARTKKPTKRPKDDDLRHEIEHNRKQAFRGQRGRGNWRGRGRGCGRGGDRRQERDQYGPDEGFYPTRNNQPRNHRR